MDEEWVSYKLLHYCHREICRTSDQKMEGITHTGETCSRIIPTELNHKDYDNDLITFVLQIDSNLGNL